MKRLLVVTGVSLAVLLTVFALRWLNAVPAPFLPIPKALATVFGLAPASTAGPGPVIQWEELVPKGWDPAAEFKGLDFSSMQDSDPRAIAALESLRRAWDNAPVDPAMNGKTGRIAGYALPLEWQGNKVTEFLIVPYFGACIHTPPPPANQIIHAKSATPLAGVKMMTPIWTHGSIAVQRAQSEWGVAGYRMSVERVTPYEEPKPRTP